jgi:hypothetical protein
MDTAGQRVTEPVAEEGAARQRLSHLPVALQYLLEKGMGEEGEPLADGEPAGTLAGDADGEAFEVDVGVLDTGNLGGAQAAGDAQGEDAQIPAVDEQGEPVGLSAAAQPLVVAFDARQQPHELEG